MIKKKKRAGMIKRSKDRKRKKFEETSKIKGKKWGPGAMVGLPGDQAGRRRSKTLCSPEPDLQARGPRCGLDLGEAKELLMGLATKKIYYLKKKKKEWY